MVGSFPVQRTATRTLRSRDHSLSRQLCQQRALNACSCRQRAWNEPGTSGSSTASTCVLCSEDRSDTSQDKCYVNYERTPEEYDRTATESVDLSETDERSEYSRCSKNAFAKSSQVNYVASPEEYDRTPTESVDLSKTDETSENSRCSKNAPAKSSHANYGELLEEYDRTATESVDLSKTDEKSEYSRCSYAYAKSVNSKSDYSKLSKTVTKESDVTSKRITPANLVTNSGITCEFKYGDSDDDEETTRLILLRNEDYMDTVDQKLKIVVALSGYPKSKMTLKQMDLFQSSLNAIIDMQLKAGLMKEIPQFLDYYLNRGAIVCICKDIESRNWLVRITPGLQERMFDKVVLLKTNVKRLCLAVTKIPKTCWPATARDAFRLLQYFNPSLKTHLWNIYDQKTVDNVEITSFVVDKVSGEILRGPNFKNVIDYNQIEFELTGYAEIYYECFLSEMDEDVSSVASRVKLLEELRSNEATPRNKDANVGHKKDRKSNINLAETTESIKAARKEENEKIIDVRKKIVETPNVMDTSNQVLSTMTENTCKVVVNETKEKNEVNESKIAFNEVNTSLADISDVTGSIVESNENLVIGGNSYFNIDSNRGIAYHRRTNYLHVENELKIAIVLEGYPQDKLDGTHIRRLKHLFKEHLSKDLKMQRFNNMIIPKFQDIYLSNGAVIYICDSLETKDYITEILPKFITSTGLKLTFRDLRNLVRYTRIVMRVPKKLAHVESREILHKLQEKYPKLKPDNWKYYSDIAGKQKRQFGVDPESLDAIKSPHFDASYENEKLSFRIIDRQKPEYNFEDSHLTEDNKEMKDEEAKKLKERIAKNMYCAIEPRMMNASLAKRRTNHYSEVIADDFKLYVGPTNYPETRIDEAMFFSIKKTIENIVYDAVKNGNDEFIPKIHDIYLFDGVIFTICQDMTSRVWIENNIPTINMKLNGNYKATEFRGSVGIVSMTVNTDKDYDEVVNILQMRNPRLRTKYWRQISKDKSPVKLDVVLQIDKLSAHVISDSKFDGRIGHSVAEFKLGHLKSLLNKKSLEELSKVSTKPNIEIKRHVDIQTTVDEESNNNNIDSSQKEAIDIADNTQTDKKKEFVNEKLNLKGGESKVFFYDHKYKSDKKSIRSYNYVEENEEALTKIILKVPTNILPDFEDGLDIIFDLLEDKNPGLNTELWKVMEESEYNRGKFVVFVDSQSASIIRGKDFDPTLAGQKLKFLFYRSRY